MPVSLSPPTAARLVGAAEAAQGLTLPITAVGLPEIASACW
jgi:hypothetical protein